MVERALDLKRGDAEGKIDVAKALGLLFSVGSKFALSDKGRALVALSGVHGHDSSVLRIFFLRRVLECDGDLTLTLLSAMAEEPTGELAETFLAKLDALLQLKRRTYTGLARDPGLKREIGRILTVRESQPKMAGFGNRAVVEIRRRGLSRTQRPGVQDKAHSSYECIEIPPGQIEHYVRHTITPRRSWLKDLALLERPRGLRMLTSAARNVMTFLEGCRTVQENVIGLEPDEDVLQDVLGVGHLLLRRGVTPSFFDCLVASAYSEGPVGRAELSAGAFLLLVEEAYRKVKLETFEQAEVSAIREFIMPPLLAVGRVVPFELLLESAIREFPDRIHRLSSRQQAGTYISLKGRAR